MSKTLATVNTTTTSQAITPAAPTTKMEVMLPPGFEEAPSRPIVYVGGESEGGAPFYVWNRDKEAKDFIPTKRFSATLLDVKTLVRNPDDAVKRSVKLVLEFSTASGERVAFSMGANTYAGMGALAGLSALSSEQLAAPIGLSGKVGNQGRVTFVSIYSDGKLMRNVDAEDLLKECRGGDSYLPAVEGLIANIREKLG